MIHKGGGGLNILSLYSPNHRITNLRYSDILSVRALIEGYCDAVNQRNIDSYAALWCDDASWVLNGKAITGKESILTTWTGAMSHFEYVFFLAMPGHINVSGGTASARTYVNEHVISVDGIERYIDGLYEDEFRKDDDEWKFYKRQYSVVKENRR